MPRTSADVSSAEVLCLQTTSNCFQTAGSRLMPFATLRRSLRSRLRYFLRPRFCRPSGDFYLSSRIPVLKCDRTALLTVLSYASAPVENPIVVTITKCLPIDPYSFPQVVFLGSSRTFWSQSCPALINLYDSVVSARTLSNPLAIINNLLPLVDLTLSAN